MLTGNFFNAQNLNFVAYNLSWDIVTMKKNNQTEDDKINKDNSSSLPKYMKKHIDPEFWSKTFFANEKVVFVCLLACFSLSNKQKDQFLS